jgi:hypothetical protein
VSEREAQALRTWRGSSPKFLDFSRGAALAISMRHEYGPLDRDRSEHPKHRRYLSLLRPLV